MKQINSDSARLLKPAVADLFVLYVKARNYHWNVIGNQFFGLHAQFEKLYDELAEDIDVLAERLRTLGAYAPGSMSEFLKLASLKEESEGNYPEQMKMVENIVNDLEAIVDNLKTIAAKFQSDYKDEISAGIIYPIVEKYEKLLWMLNSSLITK